MSQVSAQNKARTLSDIFASAKILKSTALVFFQDIYRPFFIDNSGYSEPVVFQIFSSSIYLKSVAALYYEDAANDC